jgi:hypothetical protein
VTARPRYGAVGVVMSPLQESDTENGPLNRTIQ